jgi:prevent-host-death family protein
MNTISADEAGTRLEQLIDEIAESHVRVTITSGQNAAVLMSAADWTAIHSALNQRSTDEQAGYIARGLAARESARCTGDYVDSDEVLAELDAMVAAAAAKRRN